MISHGPMKVSCDAAQSKLSGCRSGQIAVSGKTTAISHGKFNEASVATSKRLFDRVTKSATLFASSAQCEPSDALDGL